MTEVAFDETLHALGMDSLMAVELTGRLRNFSGLAIPVTLVFEHETVPALSNYIVANVRELLPSQTEVKDYLTNRFAIHHQQPKAAGGSQELPPRPASPLQMVRSPSLVRSPSTQVHMVTYPSSTKIPNW